MRHDRIYTLLTAAVLALALVPVGSAVFILGFIHGDSPCVMCWQQRTGMAIVALIGIFILRYGPRPKLIGLAVLVGAFGVHMGVRHTGMHAARDVGQGFSLEILGAHTYTWALFIFWVCIVVMGLLLTLFGNRLPDTAGHRPLRPFERATTPVALPSRCSTCTTSVLKRTSPPRCSMSCCVRSHSMPGPKRG